ncbi:PrsW family intramembrane metalloprotease [Terrisporobacter mayombei]|uniref:Protease PrsW n=1 Tax=Terrisporobacter mayombei TaxID=1541 RepID=A0ABY9Q2T9_9FIRM|nr:PrsW family glutamic-type intramembrane protease [Terrisporobacter mayombei]MCC3869465.1 PrsW family intramembrane metalloprotease [Terrisporobacter mayombei]WMT82296.1 Protease PrsW [Terrisporobacter mayombei]
MKIYILALAVLPVIFFVGWIYFKDRYEKEPPLKLIEYFLLGILVSILAILLEFYFSKLNIFSGIMGTLYIAFFVAAFTEEGLKSIILIPVLLKDKNFNEKLDGIIYSIFLSLGFATIENIIYLMRERLDLSFELAVTRGLISVPSHIMFAITMGYYISKYKFSKEDDNGRNKYLIYAVIIPILLHGVFDFILMIGYRWAIIVFIVYIIFLWKVNLDKLDRYALYSKIRFYKRKNKSRKGDKID